MIPCPSQTGHRRRHDEKIVPGPTGGQRSKNQPVWLLLGRRVMILDAMIIWKGLGRPWKPYMVRMGRRQRPCCRYWGESSTVTGQKLREYVERARVGERIVPASTERPTTQWQRQPHNLTCPVGMEHEVCKKLLLVGGTHRRMDHGQKATTKEALSPKNSDRPPRMFFVAIK